MPDYAFLMRYTEQGRGDIKTSPQRIKDAKALVEKLGGRVTGVWMIMGKYDLMAVASFPDDETATLFSMGLCRIGNVTTHTMRAFNEDELAKIAARLPGPA